MSLGQPEQTKNKEKQMKKKTHTQRADYKLTKINERPCHEILVFLGGGVGWGGGEDIYFCKSNTIVSVVSEFLNTGRFKYGSNSGHFLYLIKNIRK